MKITVVGAGNAGYSHSAMFSERGHEVTLLKTTHLMYDERFKIMVEEFGKIIYPTYNEL